MKLRSRGQLARARVVIKRGGSYRIAAQSEKFNFGGVAWQQEPGVVMANHRCATATKPAPRAPRRRGSVPDWPLRVGRA